MHVFSQVYIILMLVSSVLGLLIRGYLVGKTRTVTIKTSHFFYALISNFVFAAWLVIAVWPKV